MKSILFLVLITLSSCDKPITIISTVKQRIIPGFKNAKPYINYHLEIKVNKTNTIHLDSVHVFDNQKCYTIKPLVKAKKGEPSIKNSIQKGIYTVDVRLKGNTIISMNNCKFTDKKVILYFNEESKKGNIVITKFTNKTIRKR